MEDFLEVPASKKSLAKRKPVLSVGINDADYITEHRIKGKQLRCPFYRTWVGVLERCYADFAHTKYPTYQGCTICMSGNYFLISKIG